MTCVFRRFTVFVIALVACMPVTTASAEGYPTIDGQYSGVGTIGPGGTLHLTVLGRGGVPVSGVDAVALNVTVTNPTAGSFLTVWPAGAPRPTASNLNYQEGQTTPNMVIAKVGDAGQVSLYNLAGNVDVIVDVLGWFPTGGAYTGLTPARVVDTRFGSPTIDMLYAGIGAVGSASALDVSMLGRGGVPTSGVDAVVLNVTATGPTADSYLTVWPTGATRPTASNLNYTAGATTPNLVIAKLGTAGQVSMYNLTGSVDVVVDVLGWFPTGGSYTGVTPARLLETRPGLPTVDGDFAATGPVSAGGTFSLTVTGRGGVPATGVGAVAVNVTATGPTAESFVTVWPAGLQRPTASNLNFLAGQTRPNMVIATVGTNGQISLFNLAGSVDVIVDVLGWFPTTNAFTGLAPARLLDTRIVRDAPPLTVTTLQPGSQVVNSAVPPGRYAADSAANTCYWERSSVVGGTPADVIAFGYATFGGRVIVDILGTDAAFYFDAPCGTFSTYVAPASPSSTIAPGAHVVGGHIAPGTYTTTTASGCEWKRLRNFEGTTAGVIATDTPAPGPVSVTISPSDMGFSANDACGTWART